MKRIISVLMTVLLTLSLFGCSSPKTPEIINPDDYITIRQALYSTELMSSYLGDKYLGDFTKVKALIRFSNPGQITIKSLIFSIMIHDEEGNKLETEAFSTPSNLLSVKSGGSNEFATTVWSEYNTPFVSMTIYSIQITYADIDTESVSLDYNFKMEKIGKITEQ